MNKNFSTAISKGKKYLFNHAQKLGLNIRIIDNVQDLKTFTDNSIINLNDMTRDPLFNSAPWLHAWLDAFSLEECIPFVVATYKHNQLKGVMAAQLSHINFLGKFLLKPLGQGEPEHEEILSEYQDICCSEELKQIFLTLISDFINVFCYRVIWRNTYANANIVVCLDANIGPLQYSHFLFDKSRSDLPQTLTKNTLKQYKRLNNKLNAMDHKFYWCESQDKVATFQRLVELHRIRWNELGSAGAMSSKRFQAFHHRILEQDTMARFSVLEINNKVVAIHYYLSASNTLYFYQSGWSTQQHQELSLGFMLHIWSINNSPEECYDFMIAKNNNRFKQQLSNVTESTVSIDYYVSPIYCKCSIAWHRIIGKFKSTFKR